MSSSPPDDRSLESTTESTDDAEADASEAFLAALVPTVAASVRKLGFWSAIVLPIVYVPILAGGLSTSVDAASFLGLLALNLAALYAGRAYRR